MNEAFLRTQMLLGADAMARLRRCHVIVFGLGGVGSYAAECLARSGVGELTLVDQDTISVTNINRQLYAVLPRTVGVGDADAPFRAEGQVTVRQGEGQRIAAAALDADRPVRQLRHRCAGLLLPPYGDDQRQLVAVPGLGQVEQQRRDHGQRDDHGGHQRVQRLRPQAGL